MALRVDYSEARLAGLSLAKVANPMCEEPVQTSRALCKSESKVPFLQISSVDGDLVLTTQQGIYPDKIDKGCLIINHSRSEGFVVYLFDNGGVLRVASDSTWAWT